MAQERAACLNECAGAGEPDIGELGRNERLIAVGLAGEEFGFEARLEYGLGFGGVLVADDVDQGQGGEGLCAGVGALAETIVCVGEEGVEAGVLSGAAGIGTVKGRQIFLLIPEVEEECSNTDTAEEEAEDDEFHAFHVEEQGGSDDDGEVDDKDDESNPGTLHAATPAMRLRREELMARRAVGMAPTPDLRSRV